MDPFVDLFSLPSAQQTESKPASGFSFINSNPNAPANPPSLEASGFSFLSNTSQPSANSNTTSRIESAFDFLGESLVQNEALKPLQSGASETSTAGKAGPTSFDFSKQSASELKKYLESQNVDYSQCVEKAELVALAQRTAGINSTVSSNFSSLGIATNSSNFARAVVSALPNAFEALSFADNAKEAMMRVEHEQKYISQIASSNSDFEHITPDKVDLSSLQVPALPLEKLGVPMPRVSLSNHIREVPASYIYQYTTDFTSNRMRGDHSAEAKESISDKRAILRPYLQPSHPTVGPSRAFEIPLRVDTPAENIMSAIRDACQTMGLTTVAFTSQAIVCCQRVSVPSAAWDRFLRSIQPPATSGGKKAPLPPVVIHAGRTESNATKNSSSRDSGVFSIFQGRVTYVNTFVFFLGANVAHRRILLALSSKSTIPSSLSQDQQQVQFGPLVTRDEVFSTISSKDSKNDSSSLLESVLNPVTAAGVGLYCCLATQKYVPLESYKELTDILDAPVSDGVSIPEKEETDLLYVPALPPDVDEGLSSAPGLIGGADVFEVETMRGNAKGSLELEDIEKLVPSFYDGSTTRSAFSQSSLPPAAPGAPPNYPFGMVSNWSSLRVDFLNVLWKPYGGAGDTSKNSTSGNQNLSTKAASSDIFQSLGDVFSKPESVSMTPHAPEFAVTDIDDDCIHVLVGVVSILRNDAKYRILEESVWLDAIGASKRILETYKYKSSTGSKAMSTFETEGIRSSADVIRAIEGESMHSSASLPFQVHNDTRHMLSASWRVKYEQQLYDSSLIYEHQALLDEAVKNSISIALKPVMNHLGIAPPPVPPLPDILSMSLNPADMESMIAKYTPYPLPPSVCFPSALQAASVILREKKQDDLEILHFPLVVDGLTSQEIVLRDVYLRAYAICRQLEYATALISYESQHKILKEMHLRLLRKKIHTSLRCAAAFASALQLVYLVQAETIRPSAASGLLLRVANHQGQTPYAQAQHMLSSVSHFDKEALLLFAGCVGSKIPGSFLITVNRFMFQGNVLGIGGRKSHMVIDDILSVVPSATGFGLDNTASITYVDREFEETAIAKKQKEKEKEIARNQPHVPKDNKIRKPIFSLTEGLKPLAKESNVSSLGFAMESVSSSTYAADDIFSAKPAPSGASSNVHTAINDAFDSLVPVETTEESAAPNLLDPFGLPLTASQNADGHARSRRASSQPSQFASLTQVPSNDSAHKLLQELTEADSLHFFAKQVDPEFVQHLHITPMTDQATRYEIVFLLQFLRQLHKRGANTFFDFLIPKAFVDTLQIQRFKMAKFVLEKDHLHRVPYIAVPQYLQYCEDTISPAITNKAAFSVHSFYELLEGLKPVEVQKATPTSAFSSSNTKTNVQKEKQTNSLAEFADIFSVALPQETPSANPTPESADTLSYAIDALAGMNEL